MKNRFFAILLNPYFLSLIISLSIFLFLPNYFPRYTLELKQKELINSGFRVYYVDLNNDGLSEKFLGVMPQEKGREATFILYNGMGDLLDQWRFLSDIAWEYSPNWFFDLDGNGFKEVYFITHKDDSAYLNIVEPISTGGINHDEKQLFVDKLVKYECKVNFGPEGAILGNHFSGGVKSLYFALGAGYAGYPRNAYKYDFNNDTVVKSEYLTNISRLTNVVDLNEDGDDEVLFLNFSYGNELDPRYTNRSDYSLWLNVLDHDLNFFFEPIEFKVPFSELHTLPFKNRDEVQILTYLHSRQKEASASKLMVYSNAGEQLKSKELGEGFHQVFLNSQEDGFLLFNSTDGELQRLNFDLEVLSTVFLDPFSDWYEMDINEDGNKEWLRISSDKKNFKIYPENFKTPVSYDFSDEDNSRLFFGIRKTKEGNQFYVQKVGFCYLFSYGENKYYYLNFLVFPFIYLVVLGLVWVIIKGQEIKAEKQRAIENQIAELQIKTIKNQVDPHFVFNAINTISEMMLTNNKMEADNFICKFSDLMRATLQKSDKIICSLKDEIDYVETFIQLQQMRFSNRFEYSISIAEGVDLQHEVPKHVLYSYAENAIKHGLATKADGLLKIEVSYQNNKLLLVIEDNGGGLVQSETAKKNSTGNGLLIMEKIYNLYAQLYKKKIICQMTNAEDQILAKGLRVNILIDK